MARNLLGAAPIRRSSASTGVAAAWINHSWHATLYVDARGLTRRRFPMEHWRYRDCLRPDRPCGRSATATDGRSRIRRSVRCRSGVPRKVRGRSANWAASPHRGCPAKMAKPVPFAGSRRRPYDRRTRKPRHSGPALRSIAMLKRFRDRLSWNGQARHLLLGQRRSCGRPRSRAVRAPHAPRRQSRHRQTSVDAVSAYSHEVSSAGSGLAERRSIIPAFEAVRLSALRTDLPTCATSRRRAACFRHRALARVPASRTSRAGSGAIPEATLRLVPEIDLSALRPILAGWDRAALACARQASRCRPRSACERCRHAGLATSSLSSPWK